jgi:NADH-quinone oxidoreductase subunit J
MVLFAFVVMMLSLGRRAATLERRRMPPLAWIGPGALALMLAAELGYLLLASPLPGGSGATATVGPAQVGRALFGPYLLAVELASMLLLAALVGAYHLGREPEAS